MGNQFTQNFGQHAMNKISVEQSFSNLTVNLLVHIEKLEQAGTHQSEFHSTDLLKQISEKSILKECKNNGLYAKAVHLHNQPFGFGDSFFFIEREPL